MKQIIQNNKTGELKIDEVSIPVLRKGGVLVRNCYSVISAGTEKTKIDMGRKSLIDKAKARPDLVKKVIEKVKTEGIVKTYQTVTSRLSAPSPLGYSSAGVVIDVAADVRGIGIGDAVSCAGADYANHAEIVYVPKNLCAKIPEGVSLREAAYTTIGAIALQGVRQADLRLGERVCVIGLGLLGQITLQIARASGCRVIAVDLDAGKVQLAERLGAEKGLISGKDDVEGFVKAWTNGYGVDAVLITAATKSNQPIESAGKICREKGTVVVVGAVSMDVPREPYYLKEINLKISRSYGPGRYDNSYEEKGQDYPYGYVRWTENRNMEAFLRLLAEKKADMELLTTHTFKLEEAGNAYDMIAKGEQGHIGILLEYEQKEEEKKEIITIGETEKPESRKQINIGVVGAGNFATATMFPVLKKLEGVNLYAICDAQGPRAKYAAQRFGFDKCFSTPEGLLDDDALNLLAVTTPHSEHSALVAGALKRNKDVFVEKPLALNRGEVDNIVELKKKSRGRVLVGFNRRFSPLSLKVKEFFSSRNTPLMIDCRVNAGRIEKSHWIQDPEVGGGRIIGEVCHFVDLLSFITGARPVSVFAAAVEDRDKDIVTRDNVSTVINFSDGSVGSILYTAEGDKVVEKERIEVFGSGKTAIINDFKSVQFAEGGRIKKIKLKTQDKGHFREWEVFVEAIKQGKDSPIPFSEILSTTLATFEIVESLRTSSMRKIPSLKMP